jgi:hypothetical protein
MVLSTMTTLRDRMSLHNQAIRMDGMAARTQMLRMLLSSKKHQTGCQK